MVEHGRYKPVAGSQMAAPNVIPMADIMLVLLIIFMVVTPMLQKDHPVDLARTDNAKDMLDADKEDAIVVAITDRKSTRLNSSHLVISYAVFCLKKKIITSSKAYDFTLAVHHTLATCA